MTRLGLRNFTCLLPAETLDHGHHEWSEEVEQPGTSYNSKGNFSYTENRKVKGSAAAGEFEGARGRERMNCSSGGAHMLACFRAGAINLIVHPAMVSIGGQKQGASTVQPLNSLPRGGFLDGAADHDSGDDPTSPVVTCIGQVKKDKSKTPPKTPPKTPTNAAEAAPDLRSLKSMREKPQRFESASAPSSPKPSRWRQFLGPRGMLNPSVQSRNENEFHVDLNRFSSACSSIAKTAPTLDMKSSRTQTGTFLAKSLMMLQLECDSARDESPGVSDVSASKTKPSEIKCNEETKCIASRPPAAVCNNTRGGSDEVLLWKRRSGAKPLTLDLKRRAV